MKKIVTFVFLALLIPGLAAAADNYNVDKVHSSVLFRIQHLGVSYVWGRFNDISGTFTIDEAAPDKSVVDITVKTESVDTDDAKRDKHLRSPDFFIAKTFPVMTFKSTSVKSDGKDHLAVTGELTLHGVTKTVTIPVTRIGTGKDPWGGTRTGFEGELTIKRSDYGVSYMPGGLGEDVRLVLGIEGVRN